MHASRIHLMPTRMVLGLSLLCLMAAPLLADDNAWTLRKDEDGIQIFTRSVDGSKYDEVRATTQIKGRVSSVVALLQDPAYVPKLNDIISLVRLHEQLAADESMVYMQMEMPWPVSDRDILTHRRVVQDDDSKVVTITELATTDVLPQEKGFIRVVQSRQQWTLTPHADGTVDLDWITHTDPNGSLPSSLVNYLSVGVPHGSMTVLRDAIESGEFADAQLPYVVEPQASAQAMKE